MGDDGLLTQEEMEKIGLEADQVELSLINREVHFWKINQILRFPLRPEGAFIYYLLAYGISNGVLIIVTTNTNYKMDFLAWNQLNELKCHRRG